MGIRSEARAGSLGYEIAWPIYVCVSGYDKSVRHVYREYGVFCCGWILVLFFYVGFGDLFSFG